MIFKDIPTHTAQGAILARRAGALKKGRVLSMRDIAMLTRSGVASLLVARLEADDVAEADAAQALARASAGAHIRAAPVVNGRCDLYARKTGLLDYNPAQLARVNRVHEAMMLAARAPFAHLRAGEKLATIKLIPFSVSARHLAQAVKRAQTPAPLLCVRAFRPLRAGLICTEEAGRKSTTEKAKRITASRLAHLGSRLAANAVCAHDKDALAEALRAMVAKKLHIILINGAYAIMDRRDVIPSAIKAAGGALLHFGMPADPGNLLLLARLRGVPVIGLPGCARSPVRNGFDWVLERIATGMDIKPADIAAMGAGGLFAGA